MKYWRWYHKDCMSLKDTNPFSQSNTRREGVVIAVVAVFVILGLGCVTWNLVEGSETRVDMVKETKLVSVGVLTWHWQQRPT